MQQLLRRHGKPYHERVLALVHANPRLRRIARPHELLLSYYYPPPLDLYGHSWSMLCTAVRRTG